MKLETFRGTADSGVLERVWSLCTTQWSFYPRTADGPLCEKRSPLHHSVALYPLPHQVLCPSTIRHIMYMLAIWQSIRRRTWLPDRPTYRRW